MPERSPVVGAATKQELAAKLHIQVQHPKAHPADYQPCRVKPPSGVERAERSPEHAADSENEEVVAS